MKNMDFISKKLTDLLYTGIFLSDKDGLVSYEENPEYNPVYCSEALRQLLQLRADTQSVPVIFMDQFNVCFVCIKENDAYYMAGPLCTTSLSSLEAHKFYRNYGVERSWEKGLYYHTLIEVLQAVELLAMLITGTEYTDETLVLENELTNLTKEQEQMEWNQFNFKEENEDIYRHTYQEERKILDNVREGNVEEAVRLSKEIDTKVGKLASNEIDHWRNLLTVVSTLVARAAIEGGLEPRLAYRVSGFYINKGAECKSIAQVIACRNHAVEELTERVRKVKTRAQSSSYTTRCKDYIQKNYKHKIYLEEISEALGVSKSYLSRTFKKEAGMTIQEYINEVRVDKAADLLAYSDESLSTIAEAVNFPSQSYFGKIFKEHKGLTPRLYREKYQPSEFHHPNTKKNKNSE